MAIGAARGGKELLSARKVAALINAADRGEVLWKDPKDPKGERIKVFRRHPDGEDLYLSIKKPKESKRGKLLCSCSWVFLYWFGGKPWELGLGSARNENNLANARMGAKKHRAVLAQGRNPKFEKAVVEVDTNSITLGFCCDEWLRLNEERLATSTFKNLVSLLSLKNSPELRNKPIEQITKNDIVLALIPLVPSQRIVLKRQLKIVFDWAEDCRDDYNLTFPIGNPCSFKIGNRISMPELEVEHFEAMQVPDVPEYLSELRAVGSIPALELEFQILCGLRPGESRGCLWTELPEQLVPDAILTIPGSRMKKKKLHRVPLSTQAVAILERIKDMRRNAPLVFASKKTGGEIAGQTILNLIPNDRYLSNNNKPGVAHGFRSSFRDWAAGKEINEIVSEWCLAHILGSATLNAYRRYDYLSERREVLQQWADFCCSIPTIDKSALPKYLLRPHKKSPEERRTYIREYMRERRDKEYAAEGKQAKP